MNEPRVSVAGHGILCINRHIERGTANKFPNSTRKDEDEKNRLNAVLLNSRLTILIVFHYHLIKTIDHPPPPPPVSSLIVNKLFPFVVLLDGQYWFRD